MITTANEVSIMPKATDTVVHDKTNSWYDGEKWIPVSEMTTTHLRKAKLFAQKKQEYFWHKSSEFSDKVEMLDEEAERRKIKLKDYQSKFSRMTHKAKEINKSL